MAAGRRTSTAARSGLPAHRIPAAGAMATAAVPAAIRAAATAIPALLAILLAGAPAPAAGAAPGDGPNCVVLPFAPGGSSDGATLRADGRRAADGLPYAAPPASVGSIHLLVLLVQFSDLPHVVPASRFPDHLFGSGATLRDYYDVLSGGRLQLSGDVYGWYTLPHTLTYYSPGNGGLGTYPRNGQGMAEDAVAAAVAAGVNLGDYDADGDGQVDALLVIHSGQGAEWASSPDNTPSVEPNAINSHKWVTLQTDFGSTARVKDYFTCPEKQIVYTDDDHYPDWSDNIATIGVYCHEFGHVLGLPDLYDTNTFHNRVGVWDVMDFGTWNYVPGVPSTSVPGSLPSGFSAWCRMFLGWEAPIEVTPPAGEAVTRSVTLGSASLGSPALQLLHNPGGVDWTQTSPGTGEYFVAEVRTRDGYDAGLPGEGVLLYHVDEREATNREVDATFRGGGLLVLVPQDGALAMNLTSLVADPWPGVQDTFDDASTPSSAFFSGAASGVTIAGMSPLSGSSVSAIVSVTNHAPTPLFPFPRPMPWNARTEGSVQIVLAEPGRTGSTVIRIHDVLGRPVRTLDAPGEFLEAGRVAVWDGNDDAGRQAPAGMYVFRAESPAGGTGKVLLLR